jgi:hypothetical protein|tara:strand:- start:973 stop:1161 length:189 start_codon:yes stop_codon:yes gene_type:complete
MLFYHSLSHSGTDYKLFLFFEDRIKFRYPADVDQYVRSSKPEVHRWDQALATSEYCPLFTCR